MKNKVYFASDFHLGAITHGGTSRERELRVCRWLDEIKNDAEIIYLVGDIFDFWFEYRQVVPRGYIRLLGKLAELRDAGIPIEIFIGNHDMWLFDYFEEELNIPVHRKPIIREHGGKRFFIGHGDGLGPNDYKYKMLKKVFANKINQWLFSRIHPNISFFIAKAWSNNSRKKEKPEERSFLGKDKEWLVAYCERKLQKLDIDYFVFGHRHLPIDFLLSNQKSRYINIGDWVNHFSYGVFDYNDVKVCFYENKNGVIYPK